MHPPLTRRRVRLRPGPPSVRLEVGLGKTETRQVVYSLGKARNVTEAPLLKHTERHVDLAAKIASREAHIAVLGMGYVGRPLALGFRDAGFRVTGFDPDPERVAVEAPGLELTANRDELGSADIWIVCVPTPLDAGKPDLSLVRDAARFVGSRWKPGDLVVLESTSYPGTTREVLLPEILEAARIVGRDPEQGRDLFVAYSPERMDPGRAVPPLEAIPKVVGGLDESSGLLATQVYGALFDEVVSVSSAEVAEAAKLWENMYRSVNIALANEIKTVLSAMDVDAHEVLAAAATKPFGFQPFVPGPGPGGHCIPVDPAYFRLKAERLGVPTPLLDATDQVHKTIPTWVIDRLERALESRGKTLDGSRILVLGVAYKPDIADTRESPALTVLTELEARGARAAYVDPFVPSLTLTRRFHAVDLSRDRVKDADAVVLLTNHRTLDLGLVARHASLIVDTRNAFAPYATSLGPRWIPA